MAQSPTMNSEGSAKTSKPAKEVVVLLSREVRVSRNIRLGWYFDHLNCDVTTLPHNSSSNDSALQVISVVPHAEHDIPEQSYHIGTETKVTFHSGGYRFVFGLDLSASLLRVDTFQKLVTIEAVLTNLRDCLLALIEPYNVKGLNGDILMKPDVYVTVFAQWHGTCYGNKHEPSCERVTQKVLIQGCYLTKALVSHIVHAVKHRIYQTYRFDEPGKSKSALQKRDDILIGILRTGLLSLRLLPSNTSAGVIIVTDGVLSEPDPSSLDRLLSQCQNSTTTCSFIHVNPSAFSLCDFGCISNIELMEFIAHTTKGTYFNTFTNLCQNNLGMNKYQQSLFPWSFQAKSVNRTEIIDLDVTLDNHRSCCSNLELRSIFNAPSEPPVLLSRKQDHRQMVAPLTIAVSARLREGYEITKLVISNDVIKIQMALYWWKNCTVVEYWISSSWPLSENNSCDVQVFISGTYEFLLDVSNASKRSASSHWTRPRKLVVKRLSRFFQDLMHTDHMLVYLCTFNNDPVRYTISDILHQGQTLYCIPPNSTNFELSTPAQHTSLSFASYWKPILSLDVNIWQRWLHIHRIEVILHHDVPLPNSLHELSPGGRYYSIQCRVAFSQLVSMLRNWCSFVLLENHTYVKLIYADQNSVPSSFFLVRLSNKSPALVIKMAFLIGLSGKIRKKYITELREQLILLTPPGASSGSSSKRVRHASTKMSPGVKVNRTHFSASDKPCVILMHKPVDQLLVRYPNVPRDFLSNIYSEESLVGRKEEVVEQTIRMRDMQWYLHHRRCVWSVTNSSSTPLSMDGASNLSAFLMKLRMAEGYHIAHSSSGIINFVREFPIRPGLDSRDSTSTSNTTDYCMVQYVLFPPQLQSNGNGLSGDESDDEEENDHDRSPTQEIHLAVEVWVEPQDGLIKQTSSGNYTSSSNSTSSIFSQHQDVMYEVPSYDELTSDRVAKAVIERDSVYVSNIITLQHLVLMCSPNQACHNVGFPQKETLFKNPFDTSCPPESTSPDNNTVTSDGNITDTQSKPKFYLGSDAGYRFAQSNHIHFNPYVFDLTELLDKSSRMKHLFMALAEEETITSTSRPNDALLNNFHKFLDVYCDCTVPLTEEDQYCISKHMVQRESSHKTSHDQSDVTDQTNLDDVCKCSWGCYLKLGGKGQVFIILLPATYSDFLKIYQTFNDDSIEETSNKASSNSSRTSFINQRHPSGNSFSVGGPASTLSDSLLSSGTPLNENSGESNEFTKLQRRVSVKRLASFSREGNDTGQKEFEKRNMCKRTITVFMYNCSMNMLVSTLLQSVKNTKPTLWPDSVKDHRVYTDMSDEDDLVQTHPIPSPLKTTPSTRLSISSTADTTDDVFPLNSSETNHIHPLCDTIQELYYRSFVIGVFAAMQSGNGSAICTADLQTAAMLCHEAVNEIDITEFILLSCPQVAEFKSQNCQLTALTDLNILLSDSEIFQSDPDIEDICVKSRDNVKVIHEEDDKVERVEIRKPHSSVSTTPVPQSATMPLISSHPESSVQTTHNFADSEPVDEKDGTNINDVGITNTSKQTNFNLPLHHKSAFTTVQRNSRVRTSECNVSDSSTSEEGNYSSDKKHQSHKRERRITATLPVKRLDTRKANSMCLQTGWKNLPEFPVSLLTVPHLRHLSGSNELVEKQFHSLLRKYCNPVPSTSDLYYSITPTVLENKSSTNRFSEQGESETDGVQFEVEDSSDKRKERLSRDHCDLTPDECRSRFASYEEDDNDDVILMDSDDEINPLFLSIACSIRDKKTGNRGSMPTKGLPVKLKDVISCLEKPCDLIDLSQIKITLDLIWIFLPSSTAFKEEDNEKEERSLMPEECSPCVQGVMKQVKWLLEDEIISSLRTCEPINTTTLNKVADHIKSTQSSNCLMQSVPLQFIFGIEKSKTLFRAEFERLRIPNYKLKKENQFYYLSVERSFVPIRTFEYFQENAAVIRKHSSPFVPSQDIISIEQSVSDVNAENETRSHNNTPSTKPPIFVLDQSFSPRACGNKSDQGNFLSNSDLENAFHAPSKTTSAHDMLTNVLSEKLVNKSVYQPEDKPKPKIKKASSSIELTSFSLPSRRCTSVSCLPYGESQVALKNSEGLKTGQSKSRPSLPSMRPISSDFSDMSSSLQHKTLRSTLSCGKDRPTSFSPSNTFKGSAMSMPVTPLGLGNVESESLPHFMFPTPSVKGDGKFSTIISRDLFFSPSSDCSPRQYSQTSWLGSGYEGEESDIDDDGEHLQSMQEAFSQLPNFWLIISILDDCAKIYFHRRSSAKVFKPVKIEHDWIFKVAHENIQRACRAVNQVLLLNTLHDSLLCHPLLVEESPEDIWKKDDYSSVYHTEENANDDIVTHTHDYLAAEMDFPQGYFECPCVLHQQVPIHHRLSGPAPSPGTSASLSALSIVHSVMKNFVVINQKNMFVFQVEDGTVYYCRMHEQNKWQEHVSSRKSSLVQIDNASNSSPGIVRGSRENLNVQGRENQAKLHLDWYGVHDLTDSHKTDLEKLKESIERKLDETVIECITLLLSRNPMFKLTPADVVLIQPRVCQELRYNPQSPVDSVAFSLPCHLSHKKSLPSLLYYIHQNVLQFLSVPRYTEPFSLNGHFLPYYGSHSVNDADTDRTPSSNIYLFKSITEKGKKDQGIACISLDVQSTQRKLSEKSLDLIDQNSTYKDLLEMSKVSAISSDQFEANRIKVQFHTWTSGTLKTEHLHEKLFAAVRHAVCDAITEKILHIPLTAIKFQKTKAMKNLRSFDEDDNNINSLDVSLRANDPAKKKATANGADQELIRGSLNSFFYIVLPLWLEYKRTQLCPTLHHASAKFESRASLNQGIFNIAKLLSSILSDSKVLLYFRVEGSNLPFELADSAELAPSTPGCYYQWIIMTRNFPMWKSIIDGNVGVHKPSASTSAIQKFGPHDTSVSKVDISPCPQHALVRSSPYISRQHFVFAMTEQKVLNLYMYNISQDKANSFCELLQQCVKFHEARHHMLQGLTFQKVGLFKHYLLKNESSERHVSAASYTIEMLVRYTRMPIQDKKKQRVSHVDQHFDDMFLDHCPLEPLSTETENRKDQVSQFGQQCFAMVKDKVNLSDEKMYLKNLRRRHPSNQPVTISNSAMNIVLSHSRLIHIVSSPILLDPAARKSCEKLYQPMTYDVKSDKMESSKSQSVLSRTSSFLGSYRRKSGDSFSKMTDRHGAKSCICSYSFAYMAKKFTELYAEHWKGFNTIIVSEKKKFPDVESSPNQEKDTGCTHYMYRNMPGGIALISHTYLRDRFDVKLYHIDMTRFKDHTNLKIMRSNPNVMNDCEKLKEHMQVHLFTLDMHLRCIQLYLGGNHSVIQSGYNLIDFLRGLIICYEPLLDNISSQIYHNTHFIPCRSLNCHELFGFIVDNSLVFNFKSCRMDKEKKTELCENILYTSCSLTDCHIADCGLADHGNQNVCIVISKQESSDQDMLVLKYFLIFTKKKLPSVVESTLKKERSAKFSQFVDASVARKASLFLMQRSSESEDEAFGKQKPMKSSRPSFVECEKAQFEGALDKIGESAKTECYRQQMWNRLVLTCQDKTSPKALTATEYRKLLDMMHVVPAQEYEPKYLKVFRKTARMKQAQSLQKRILKHFQKLSSSFVYSDEKVQSVCVLSHLHKHVLVSVIIDTTAKEVGISVVLPRPEYSLFHNADLEAAAKELLWAVLNMSSTDAFLSWF
ncbi:KICSTOR complex protein SZT2-like [Clavelina lepadiformis]|uniref:KICSTOR complex protein SZT2-like n=1 Tax=Clavelina lepadiformis TaxID=159417 RepID=UPI004040F349